MRRIQERLSGHIVVLGYGISGSEAVHELIERGTDPSCIVVMDPSGERLAEAEALGCNVIEADASRKRRAEVIDKMAATLILQGALDRMRQAHLVRHDD